MFGPYRGNLGLRFLFCKFMDRAAYWSAGGYSFWKFMDVACGSVHKLARKKKNRKRKRTRPIFSQCGPHASSIRSIDSWNFQPDGLLAPQIAPRIRGATATAYRVVFFSHARRIAFYVTLKKPSTPNYRRKNSICFWLFRAGV